MVGQRHNANNNVAAYVCAGMFQTSKTSGPRIQKVVGDGDKFVYFMGPHAWVYPVNEDKAQHYMA